MGLSEIDWPKSTLFSHEKDKSLCEETDITGKVIRHEWTSVVCPSVITLKKHFRGSVLYKITSVNDNSRFVKTQVTRQTTNVCQRQS